MCLAVLALLLLRCGAQFGRTGLALPPLDIPASQYGGSWAAASSGVFTDLMKHSTPFTAGQRSASAAPYSAFGWLSTTALTWRRDGYPAGISPTPNNQWCVATTVGAGTAYYAAGRYVVLYGGNGTLELDGDAAVPPVSSAPGRVVVDITPSATGLRLRIVSSSPANPVANVRVVPLAFEATYNTTQVFQPEFLDLLRGIPLLRTAAWNRATGNPGSTRAAPRDWASRTTTTHSSQVREEDGVAVEHLAQLANTVGASLWLSLPRAANGSDSYITGVVSYLAANLQPNATLTIEYGTDGPGWITSHLPTSTQLIGSVARAAWAAAGRPAAQLRVIQTSPIINAVQNMLGQLALFPNFTSWLDGVALPASYGGGNYFTWPRDNPTGWNDPGFLAVPRPAAATLDSVMTLLRSSVLAADVSYNRQCQALRKVGLLVLGYAAGPELFGPLYGSRANYDRASVTCNSATTAWPCTFTTLYPPWGYSGGPGSVTWADAAARNATLSPSGLLAANATREAAMEALLRRARSHPAQYDIMLDSLWRWHAQMRGGGLVVDLTRNALACSSAPGTRTGTAPEECLPGGQALVVARPTDSPAFRALRAWLAAGPDGAVGALPRTSAEAPPAVTPEAACAPACVYGSCANGACECWAGASGATCATLSPAATPSACNTRMGVNLEGIADWSRSWTFLDPFKASRDWISQQLNGGPWSTGLPINLVTSPTGPGGRTALGYPASLVVDQQASTLVMRDLQGHVPGGVYTVLYDGKGALEFSMSDVKDVVYVEAGHIRVTFKPSTDFNNGILVIIQRTDPADPLRNIRLLTPGYEAAALAGRPFHPAFLAFLRPFGTLRFMDWMKTNTAGLPTAWEERSRVEDRSYAVSPGGVPLEHMVLLANMLGADPWFNMPHAASDDYISRFAQAVRDSLRPDLKVFVEYSNEVWHTGFPGGQYAQAQGLAMNTTEEGAKWYGGAVNEARLCFAALRTANISRLWKAAFGPAQAGRVVVVVSAQAVWPITASKLLTCRGAGADIDALAIAPYFGSYDKNRDTSLPVFMNVTLPGQIGGVVAQVSQHAAIAAANRKPLLAYEAGQGMVGDGSSTDLAIQANRDPAMAGVYGTYLTQLAAANVSRVVHFSSVGAFTRYGSWGMLEWQDADKRQAPKYQAVMSYINATRTCPLPPPPDPATCPGPGCSGNGDCLRNGLCACYSGYSGAGCSEVQYTEVYNCGYKCTFDQGFCNKSSVTSINPFTRTWSCTCKPGITGLACSIVSCPNGCSYNGECLDQGLCTCFPGFRGADCGQDCGCGGHGRCADNGSCICDVGWRLGAGGKCEWDCSPLH
ncbi:Tenascin-X [Tetrabaena socialis]|uniref:Tenascin-X n=1 Tax=Tetrabaena socialis TaxID=47790 RepID=A0A2J7ZRJ1_9CHLO|nr:Tenascin-X [Tetrabaena socialis]|eukprot:PNH02889.1 Tenascin-X [Tetrabaena socialis]